MAGKRDHQRGLATKAIGCNARRQRLVRKLLPQRIAFEKFGNKRGGAVL